SRAKEPGLRPRPSDRGTLRHYRQGRRPGQRRTDAPDDALLAEGAIQPRVPYREERTSLLRPDRHQRRHEAETGNARRSSLPAELRDGHNGPRNDDAGVRRLPFRTGGKARTG